MRISLISSSNQLLYNNYYNSGKPPKIQEDFSSDLEKLLLEEENLLLEEEKSLLEEGKYVLRMCSMGQFFF